MNSNTTPPSHPTYSEVRTAPFELGNTLKDIGEGLVNGQKEADSRNHDIQSSITSDNQTSRGSGGSGYGSNAYGSGGYGD